MYVENPTGFTHRKKWISAPTLYSTEKKTISGGFRNLNVQVKTRNLLELCNQQSDMVI